MGAGTAFAKGADVFCSSRRWDRRPRLVYNFAKSGISSGESTRQYVLKDPTRHGRYCVCDCETCSQECGHGSHASEGEARRRELLAYLSGIGLLMNMVDPRVGAVEAETVVCSVSELLNAIEKAPPGAVIVLEPGRYETRLVLDKPVTIRSGSGRVEILWDTEQPYESTITCHGPGVHLLGLTIVHRSPSIANNYAIYLVDSVESSIKDCDISSMSGSGIGFEGGQALLLQTSRIHDCKLNGVLIASDIEGDPGCDLVVDSCTVDRNGKDGILMKSADGARIVDCCISGNRGYGLSLFDSQPRGVVGNTISKNTKGPVFFDLLCRDLENSPVFKNNSFLS